MPTDEQLALRILLGDAEAREFYLRWLAEFAVAEQAGAPDPYPLSRCARLCAEAMDCAPDPHAPQTEASKAKALQASVLAWGARQRREQARRASPPRKAAPAN